MLWGHHFFYPPSSSPPFAIRYFGQILFINNPILWLLGILRISFLILNPPFLILNHHFLSLQTFLRLSDLWNFSRSPPRLFLYLSSFLNSGGTTIVGMTILISLKTGSSSLLCFVWALLYSSFTHYWLVQQGTCALLRPFLRTSIHITALLHW